MKDSKLPNGGKSVKIKQALVREIRRLHSRREPLNLAAVKRAHPALIRQVFGVRPFWGWIQALRDAGISYDEIHVELNEFIDCRICGLPYRRLQKHLPFHGITAEAYRQEFKTETSSEAERANNQRKNLREVEGREQLPLWDAPWCEEIILDRIAEYHRRGISLHFNEIDHREPSLVKHAVGYFGHWDRALRKVGLDPAKVRRTPPPGRLIYPTADSVLKGIRKRHKNRLPLNAKALMAPLGSPLKRDEALFKQGILYFGTWDEAILHAGLPQQRLVAAVRYRKPKAILDEIRRRHRAGMPLSAIELTAGEKKNRDIALYRHGRRMFGSWNHAIAKAGLAPQARRFRGGRYPTPESVIDEIRRRAQAGLPLNSYQIVAGSRRDAPLMKCAIRHFTMWSKALEAAQVGPLISGPVARGNADRETGGGRQTHG